MISPRIHGPAAASSSRKLSPRVASPAVYLHIAPWNKPFTSLRHSNSCRKSYIKVQSNINPIPNHGLSNQKNPRNIFGPSATKTMTWFTSMKTYITITPPNDLVYEQESGDGIGIVEFLKGKNYFVTGATGLLAKVFIEKVLRMSPDVGKIYVLIRAKGEETALHRLKEEVAGMSEKNGVNSCHHGLWQLKWIDIVAIIK